MKILVVEDKEKHRKSAEETLAGHEVTIVGSFNEAMNLLKRKIDNENVKRLLLEAGHPTKNPYYEDGAKQKIYEEALFEAKEKSTIPFPFTVVLTDMMMPMSRETLAPGVYKPDELVPYGFIIALMAARAGAKFVAVVTDTNHHESAISAATDYLAPSYYRWWHNLHAEEAGDAPKTFNINDARVVYVHAPFIDEKRANWSDEVYAKDWARVLADLTA
jgi:CheY-like chemotaxis protein